MREIKFRVWDTLNKEYEDPTNVHIDLESGELYEVVGVPLSSKLSAGLVSIHNQERYVIEQYTGLKDKNGVEIYEGDIVRNYCATDDTEEDFRCEYRIEEQGFRFISITHEDDGWYYFKGNNNIEVIGNIHEDNAND